MTATHARRGLFARLAALISDGPSEPRIARIGIPGMAEWAVVPVPPAPEPALSPVHMCPDEFGIMPCCGSHETGVPAEDRVTILPRLVTCNDGQALTPEQLETAARITRQSQPGPLPETDPWGPWDTPDGLYMDEKTLTDLRVAPAYITVAPAYVPDVAADLTDLPVFRGAVAGRTRAHAKECLCGSGLDGDGWGERMVRAGLHLTGNEAA
jgi:hypothetical protein